MSTFSERASAVQRLNNAKNKCQLTVFSGLWLNAAAIVANDLKHEFDTIHIGLVDPTYAAFVAELAGCQAK